MNQNCIIRYFILFLVLSSITIQAQTRLSEIDGSRIKQKSIRNFLKTQSEKGIVYFEDFQPSVNAASDSGKFDYNNHKFQTHQTPESAWKAYLTSHPAKIWQGKIVSCGFVYSPKNRCPIFPDEPYVALETGQIFFVEMRIFFRLVKFPVCFVVTRIDSEKHEISFSYVETGPSKGSQSIRLISEGNRGTMIEHSSIHQTKNWLRDKTLYPVYHLKAIGEVHRNIRKVLE